MTVNEEEVGQAVVEVGRLQARDSTKVVMGIRGAVPAEALEERRAVAVDAAVVLLPRCILLRRLEQQDAVCRFQSLVRVEWRVMPTRIVNSLFLDTKRCGRAV